MTSQELNEKRLGMVAQMRAMHDKVNEEKRDGFTAEEQEKYDKMRADEKNLLARRDQALHLENAEAELATPARAGARPGVSGAGTSHSPEMSAALKKAGVRPGLSGDATTDARSTSQYKESFTAMLRHGENIPMDVKATLQKTTGAQGGYLVPIEYEEQIVLKMYDANLMRQLGSVMRTTSQVNIPMEGNLPTFGWIGELGSYPATDLTVGVNILNAWKLGGIITASEELMYDAFIDLGAYIADRSAISAGFAEESAYIIGDGNQKPTGWVTTATAGGSLSGQATTAANTTVTSVDMFNLFQAVSRPYRKNGSFVVADTVLQKLRQEKASTGQYLWQPSLVANAPDVYIGKPIFTSDFLAAFAASSVSAAFGDFSYYQIVDRVGWTMQRLTELYAATGQVGFRMSERTDGKLLRPEAIAVLTTHA